MLSLVYAITLSVVSAPHSQAYINAMAWAGVDVTHDSYSRDAAADEVDNSLPAVAARYRASIAPLQHQPQPQVPQVEPVYISQLRMAMEQLAEQQRHARAVESINRTHAETLYNPYAQVRFPSGQLRTVYIVPADLW